MWCSLLYLLGITEHPACNWVVTFDIVISQCHNLPAFMCVACDHSLFLLCCYCSTLCTAGFCGQLSCFYTTGCVVCYVYSSVVRVQLLKCCTDSNQILLNDKNQQVHFVGCAPGLSPLLWSPCCCFSWVSSIHTGWHCCSTYSQCACDLCTMWGQTFYICKLQSVT